MKRTIVEGGSLPWWYGVAYYSFTADALVTYPVPWHWVVRGWRSAMIRWSLFKRLGGRPWFEQELWAARTAAWKQASHWIDDRAAEAYQRGRHDATQEAPLALEKERLATLLTECPDLWVAGDDDVMSAAGYLAAAEWLLPHLVLELTKHPEQ